MKLKESILINATPEVVWEYVGSPEHWSLFHAKASDTKLVSRQGGVVGSRYEMQMSAGGRLSPSIGEIIDIQTDRLICLGSTVEPKRGEEAVGVITYELEDLGSLTKVYERVQIETGHINFLWRAILWFISQFGRPRGETCLMKLKRIVEENA